MFDKIIMGVQAFFLAVLLYIFAVFFLCMGQEYTGVNVIKYPVKCERVTSV